jgi:uncharacterized protein
MNNAALYIGRVGHIRLRPQLHRLRYRLPYVLLDLDALPTLRWFGVARRNLMSFYPRDHGDGSERPLRAQIEARCAAIGVDLKGGRVQLLTMPRVLGFAFNPLSVYFCRDARGRTMALVHEVNNTFGERHFYVLHVTTEGPRIEQHCAKAFHVSPFMDMTLDYRFTVTLPGAQVGVEITVADLHGALLQAYFTGNRSDLTDRAILACIVRYPLLALKVVGGIHWEALLIWRKGVRLRPHPARKIEPSFAPAGPERMGGSEGVDG